MISSFRMNIKERSARMEKYAKVIVKNNSQYTDNLFTYKMKYAWGIEFLYPLEKEISQ